jgi:predicted nucleotidyltransferase
MSEVVRLVLADLQSRLGSLYGQRLTRMVLFGSRARSQAETDSDIDVMVVLRGPVAPCAEIARTESIVSELSLAHDVLLACVFVSADEFAQARSPFLLNVRREGLPV